MATRLKRITRKNTLQGLKPKQLREHVAALHRRHNREIRPFAACTDKELAEYADKLSTSAEFLKAEILRRFLERK